MRNDHIWLAACAGCLSTLIIFLSAGGMAPIRDAATWVARQAQVASVFFVQSTTSAQIQSDYQVSSVKKVRILIVPGHQPDTGGTEFGGVYERDVVVDIADALGTLLAQNPHYEVMVARAKKGWNPILQSYFDTHAEEIQTFIESQKLQMANHIADGSFLPEIGQVYHNTASATGTLQLYGINKWTSVNKYDITLHLHLNDEAERRPSAVGKYDGFAIYVPERQYSNAEASHAVAEAIAVRLNAYHATSTLPREDAGVVPDQELIAVGSNNTADNAALLIEYGYIYEPQFRNASIRSVAVADYAYQTYLGLQDFFKDPASSRYDSISVPFDWTKVTGKENERGPGVYALQVALHHLGFYPSKGKNFNDCPISGVVKVCTRSAIEGYQRARGLTVTGVLGPKTRATLTHDLLTP